MGSQGGHSGPSHGHGTHHHHHATHAQVLANHMNQHVLLSTEVTKFLKQNTKAPKALPYCADRIRQRTSTTCVLDTADDWNEQFSRRQSHLSKGFFTPQHVAYKPIGDVDLDSRNLVFRVFSATLPKKVHAAAFFIGSHKLGFTPPKTAEKSEQSSKHTPKALHDKHLGAQASQINQEAVSSAGFTYIKNYLQDSEKILVAERGGQNFEKCVADLEKARRQNENTGIQQTSVTFCPPSGSSFGVTLVPSSSHYTQVRSASTLSADSTKSDISTRTVSKTKPIDDDIEEELTRLNSLRNHRGLAEKLKAIHRLLNALHNMKSKDLRTRVPLSHEMVRFLYRHVPYERPVFSRLARTTGLQTTTTTAPMELIQSSDTVSSSDFNPSGANAPGTGTATTMNKWTSKSHLSNRSNASVKPPDVPPLSSTPVQWRKFRQNLSSLHHKSRPLDKEQRLETWEDLLAVQTSTVPSCGQQTHRFSLVSQGHAHPHTLGFSKWMAAHHRHHPERDHHHQALSTKQPYWITVAVSSADKVKRQVQTSSSSTQTDGMDPEKTLDTVRESFYKVKKKMAREVLTDIERMERERCRTFRQKFHAANEHPVMELAIKRMREAPQISRQLAVTEDSDMKEIKPSKWYIDLKKEAETAVGKDDPVINQLLQKLARWSLEDSKSIPNAKEKLCLLVMSMPASELLTIEMQQGIQFVLEHILWASRSSFSQWLTHRKIPVIIPTAH